MAIPNKKSEKKLRFIVKSDSSGLLGLADYLANVEGHEVIFCSDFDQLGEGIVTTKHDWWSYLGKKYTWIFDRAHSGGFQDWLRGQGESVFGSSDDLRTLQMDEKKQREWFKSLGFMQPESQVFPSTDEAVAFVKEARNRKWEVTAEGERYAGELEGSDDVLDRIEDMAGEFELVEVVPGLRIAALAFFDGSEFTKNEAGQVVGFLRFREKGGETLLAVTEENELFRSILLREGIKSTLSKGGFIGAFTLTCVRTDDGLIALGLEAEPRSAYALTQGIESGAGALIDNVSRGTGASVTLQAGIGLSFTVEGSGRLWVLEDGKPVEDFAPEQRVNIALDNLYKEKGYLPTQEETCVTVMMGGDSISKARAEALQWIKEHIYLAGMEFATDLGESVERFLGIVPKNAEVLDAEDKLAAKDKELQDLKKEVEEIINGD